MTDIDSKPQATPASSSRRTFVAGAVAAATTLSFPAIIRAQPLRKLRLALPYVPQGSTLYPQVAQQKGFWAKRGFDVDILSNKGSFPALQAVASGKVEFAISQVPSLIISVSKGLPLTGLAVTSYTNGWAIGLRDETPIRKASDLVGRKVGGILTTSDSIFLPEYLRRSGVDPASVPVINFDNSTQAVLLKQVDANSTVIASSAPVFLSQKVKPRYLPYADVGLDTYGHALVVNSELFQKDPDLVARFTDGLLEGVELALTDPEQALGLFFKAVLEVKLSSTGEEFARYGLGLYQYTGDASPARKTGLGTADPKAIQEQIDLVIRFLGDPGAVVPPADKVFDFRYVGKKTLTAAQWQQVVKNAAPYAGLFKAG